MADRDKAFLDEIIEARCLTPLLNDSKWVKLMAKLVECWELIKECRVKLIWEDGPAERRLLIDEHTDYNFDYYATAMEAMISGSSQGWYFYQEIEWLDFPRVAVANDTLKRPVTNGQDVEAIRQELEKIGQFHMELLDSGLRLYAYLTVL